jgi:hypothetical protein
MKENIVLFVGVLSTTYLPYIFRRSPEIEKTCGQFIQFRRQIRSNFFFAKKVDFHAGEKENCSHLYETSVHKP